MSAGQPFYFGPSDRALFGWLHPADKASAIGVVICNPYGYEALCAHRSIRHFAERIAAAGLSALRFDYDGTGDSYGHDSDAERPGAWVESIGHAVDSLREHTGVERVVVLGIRLGAALAALACEGRTDIAGLIAIAPSVNVKGYLRELRMLQLTIDAKRGVSHDNTDGVLDACGFSASAETQRVLGAIDLCTRAVAPAPRVLLLERSGLSGEDRWVDSLRARGVAVDRRQMDGYAEMMLDSHDSVVPQDMIHAAVEWLCALNASATTERSPHASVPSHRRDRCLVTPQVEEFAVRVGDASGIFGIVSALSGNRTETDRKAIVLLNAGAVHHIGPSRLYVDLARRWAQLGHIVLRFDIRGIGDSPALAGHAENVVYPSGAVSDIATAVQYLREAWGASELHAVGLCAGAYHAFKSAAASLPLKGIVLINPLVFYWRDGLSVEYPEHRIASDMQRYQTNAFRLASWIKLLRGEVHLGELAHVLARRLAALAFDPIRALGHILRIPMHKDLGADLGRAADRGVDLQFVFAREEPGIELLRNKGGYAARRLRKQGRLGVHIIDGADHTFTDRASRGALLDFLASKLDRPDGRSGSPPPETARERQRGFRETLPTLSKQPRV